MGGEEAGALRKLWNFIDGERVQAAEGSTVPVVDPSTGRPFAEAPVSGPADVDRAVRSAATAFAGWKRTTPSERSLALIRIADAIEARAEELVAAECENTGKPFALTMSEEVPPMVDQIRFFAGAARLLEGRSAGEYMAGHTSYVRREPVGVCGAVTPWNYPMMMAVWKWAPALAAGNTMVLKPSETTPVSTLLLAEIVAEFVPPGVLNVVCGDRDSGRALVEHPTPAMVSITGSVRAGMEVAATAAADLKRVHLELGGKAPVIVFDDADVEATATGVAGAAFFNAGQDCTAATRVLAGPRVHCGPAGGAGRTGQGAEGGRDLARGGRLRAAQQCRAARPGARVPRAGAGPRPASSPAASRSATRATASLRPSWPAFARTTRSSSRRCSGR